MRRGERPVLCGLYDFSEASRFLYLAASTFVSFVFQELFNLRSLSATVLACWLTFNLERPSCT